MKETEIKIQFKAFIGGSVLLSESNDLNQLIESLLVHFKKITKRNTLSKYSLVQLFINEESKKPSYIYLDDDFPLELRQHKGNSYFYVNSYPQIKEYYPPEYDENGRMSYPRGFQIINSVGTTVYIVDQDYNLVTHEMIFAAVLGKPKNYSSRERNEKFMISLKEKKNNPNKIKKGYIVEDDPDDNSSQQFKYRKSGLDWRNLKSWKRNSKRRKQWTPIAS